LRRRSHALLGAAAAIGFALLAAAPARADDPSLLPPKLVTSAPARDPRDGAAPRAAVLLELDVDRDGAVVDVRVIRSGGDALDAAAVASARGFTFVPASRDGQPIAARIRYESIFEAREPPPAAVPEAAKAGTTADADTNTAVPATTPEPETFGASARVDAPAREPTKRTLERTELTSIAGTRGDPLRGVELLPGVSRPAPNGGLPILRGANPYDSQVFMEGVPVPFLYHVGGLTSFVHARVLESVELYPSNFSVRFGRKMGGVIEAKLRDPRTDGLHGVLDVSVLDSSLLVETPITPELSVLATARRSSLDAIIDSAAGDADIGIAAAPVYWDYQSIATFRPNDADRIRLVANGSSDRLALVFKKPNDADPALRGAVEDRITFHRVQLGYRHRFSGGSEQNTEVTYGREDGVGRAGEVATYEFVANEVAGRSEWTVVMAPELRMTAGIDVWANHFSAHYAGVPLPPDEGDHPSVLSAQKKISISPSMWSVSPGAYLEAGIRPFSALLVTPGVRADFNNVVNRGSVDPRISARLELTETTAIKAGIGKFSQIPSEAEVISPVGNPNLRLPRALHLSAGVEHRVSDTFTASVEGFAKWMDRITTTTPGGEAPFFVNGQRGRVYGGELLLRVRPAGPFSGFLSYTLMRSERADDGEPFRLFNRDQTHILSASGVYRLGRGWEVGATVRYTSGTPYTPVVASTYDAANDVYLPRLGRAMSERNPAFTRIDTRVQKTWTFTKWSLAVYLDVQNVLNAENREGFTYSYDYRQREGVRGLPILPILGIRGEL
jgi:TonB family protein